MGRNDLAAPLVSAELQELSLFLCHGKIWMSTFVVFTSAQEEFVVSVLKAMVQHLTQRFTCVFLAMSPKPNSLCM